MRGKDNFIVSQWRVDGNWNGMNWRVGAPMSLGVTGMEDHLRRTQQLVEVTGWIRRGYVSSLLTVSIAAGVCGEEPQPANAGEKGWRQRAGGG